jgi:uncharacterized protein YbaR (Trm112 family)/ubiquinone/menaquinone biosynthesis C-methylase UbiE
MLQKEHLKLLVCPACKLDLKAIEDGRTISGFYCQRCRLVYPVKDEIPIILTESARNFKLEYPLIRGIQKKLTTNSPYELREAIQKTLDILRSKRGSVSWEWEDEDFWSREYAKEIIAGVSRRSNSRIWQREFLVRELTNRLSLKGKTILDVGSGEGQNFRLMLSMYCDEKSLYIATDISLNGLRLNRSGNPHKNSLYVLCSDDHELPFRNKTTDALCYFGVLHHTVNKSNNIQKDKRLVKKNGYILLAEAIDRPVLPIASRLMSKFGRSAHSERISRENLFSRLSSKEVFVPLFVRKEGTPFMTGMVRFFRNAIRDHKRFFLFLLSLDIFLSKTIGRIVPFLGAGEILVLARRNAKR